jgi:hypothetical protein
LQLQEKLAAKGAGENPEAAGAAARLCETGNHTPGGRVLGWLRCGAFWRGLRIESKIEGSVNYARPVPLDGRYKSKGRTSLTISRGRKIHQG